MLHNPVGHARDLAEGVYLGESVEQAPPVFQEGQPEPGQELMDKVGMFVVADRDTDRGILGYPRVPVSVAISSSSAVPRPPEEWAAPSAAGRTRRPPASWTRAWRTSCAVSFRSST
jgi:hypothetical protein